MAILSLLFLVACSRDVPGFADVPLHPLAGPVTTVNRGIEFFIAGTDADAVTEYYQTQMPQRKWVQVNRFGSALVFERSGRTILVSVNDIAGKTKVSIQDFPVRDEDGKP